MNQSASVAGKVNPNPLKIAQMSQQPQLLLQQRPTLEMEMEMEVEWMKKLTLPATCYKTNVRIFK